MTTVSTKLGRFERRLREIMGAGDRVAFCREVLDFEPTIGQKRWYTNATRSENALVMGNRGGKSTGEAALKIYECARRDGWTPAMIQQYDASHEPYHAINLAMSASQAVLVWTKARALVTKPKASWLVRDVKMTPFPRIEFVNGAIFEARPTARRGEYLLGNSYDRASWDEAAFEPHFEYIRDNVLRMRMVDRGGRINYITTGNGRNDFGKYYLKGLDAWQSYQAKLDRGEDVPIDCIPDFYCQAGSSYDNPYVPREELEKVAKGLNERQRRQNIEGQIVDLGGSYFPAADIDAAIDQDLDLRVPQWDDEDRERHAIVYCDGLNGVGGKEWAARYPTHRYVHGWDLADRSDWTVGETYDITTMPHTLVEFERFRRTGWRHVYDRIRVRDQKYSYSETWLDATGVGDPVLEELQDIGAQGIIFSDNAQGTGRKSQMLTNAASMLALRELRIPPIRAMLEELRFYSQPDKGLLKDCVMSLAVATEGMRLGGGEAYASEI